MRGSRLWLACALLACAVVAWGAGARIEPAGAAVDAKTPTLAACKKQVPSELYAKGKLTAATDNPAYPPWFIDGNPSNQKGYESAVTYDLASLLGFKSSKVTWVTEPYADSLLPGKKDFDFDIDEITYSPAYAKDVTFSVSYFNVNESLVVLKSDKIVTHHTASELRGYRYGAQTASPGLAFIKASIKPKHAAIVYATIDAAVSALEHGTIDAIVIDTPSGQYVAAQQVTDGEQLAQFKTSGTYYALVLQKGNPLATCVDVAIKRLQTSGTLASLSTKWLSIYNDVPFIKP